MTTSTFKHNKFIGNFLKIQLGRTGGERAHKRRMGGEHKEDGKQTSRRGAKRQARWADERMEADSGQIGKKSKTGRVQ